MTREIVFIVHCLSPHTANVGCPAGNGGYTGPVAGPAGGAMIYTCTLCDYGRCGYECVEFVWLHTKSMEISHSISGNFCTWKLCGNGCGFRPWIQTLFNFPARSHRKLHISLVIGREALSANRHRESGLRWLLLGKSHSNLVSQ